MATTQDFDLGIRKSLMRLIILALLVSSTSCSPNVKDARYVPIELEKLESEIIRTQIMDAYQYLKIEPLQKLLQTNRQYRLYRITNITDRIAISICITLPENQRRGELLVATVEGERLTSSSKVTLDANKVARINSTLSGNYVLNSSFNTKQGIDSKNLTIYEAIIDGEIYRSICANDEELFLATYNPILEFLTKLTVE